MILILILAPQPLAPGGTCPHLPSPSYATVDPPYSYPTDTLHITPKALAHVICYLSISAFEVW